MRRESKGMDKGKGLVDGIKRFDVEDLELALNSLMEVRGMTAEQFQAVFKLGEAVRMLDICLSIVAERGLPFDWLDSLISLQGGENNYANKWPVVKKDGCLRLEYASTIRENPERFMYFYPIPPIPGVEG